MKKTKKLFIKTYGCQMNVYDSERMTEALGEDGYEKTLNPDEADMILLNTCLLYTSPSPRDATLSRMPSSA